MPVWKGFEGDVGAYYETGTATFWDPPRIRYSRAAFGIYFSEITEKNGFRNQWLSGEGRVMDFLYGCY